MSSPFCVWGCKLQFKTGAVAVGAVLVAGVLQDAAAVCDVQTSALQGVRNRISGIDAGFGGDQVGTGHIAVDGGLMDADPGELLHAGHG